MLKTIGFAIPTTMITKLAKDLKAAGFNVKKDSETFVATDGDKVIARALKMRTVWCLRGDADYITAIG